MVRSSSDGGFQTLRNPQIAQPLAIGGFV